MKTTTAIKLIICLNLFIYCSCGSNESEGKGTETDSTSKTSLNTKRSGIDPKTRGGEKSAEQELIEKAMLSINESTDPILGYWVGAFGTNRINIALTTIKGNEISGHSVCAGNYRPIKGTIKLNKANPHEVTMKEPGDNIYDGEFVFRLDLNNMLLSGTWNPFKREGTSSKEYSLTKKQFEYDPSVGDYPETSQRLLTEADVENHTPEELEIMRNEIYARHGYSFKNKKMRHHFESQDWYIPVGVDIREQLTKDEVENIALIYRYEEYYKVNYDDYGR